MPTQIGIVNRALQLLGQPQVASLNENNRSSRAILRAYESVKLAELEGHCWGFSIRRAELAAAATPPLFGKGHYYPLPNDFLYRAPDEVSFGLPDKHDYEIENFQDQLCIVSDEPAPLPIRYVSNSITEAAFSATFAEALAAALAMNCCEDITDSSTKRQNLERVYQASISRAKRRNDIQKAPRKSPQCSFLSVRD
jgi:hypothetical protein